jgi:hypothetical protein
MFMQILFRFIFFYKNEFNFCNQCGRIYIIYVMSIRVYKQQVINTVEKRGKWGLDKSLKRRFLCGSQ